MQGIAGTKGALGYLPFGYYEQNKDKIKALAIDSGEQGSKPMLPTMENVLEAANMSRFPDRCSST